jgi:two-component system chemotaxis sensor kinase CheA
MATTSAAPVLLIDDSADTRELVRSVLAVHGYETVTADDGLAALAYLRRGGAASVIILDLQMPNMDGWAFRRALNANPRWSAIPVIIFSAFPPSDPGTAMGVVCKGSDDPDLLVAMVARACAAG